jgi:hypothetical protein
MGSRHRASLRLPVCPVCPHLGFRLHAHHDPPRLHAGAPPPRWLGQSQGCGQARRHQCGGPGRRPANLSGVDLGDGVDSDGRGGTLSPIMARGRLQRRRLLLQCGVAGRKERWWPRTMCHQRSVHGVRSR